MKMYPDGVVEGSPEEVAAFKHIDAALTKREQAPLKALPAPRRKKVPSTRARGSDVRRWALEEGYYVAARGAIPHDLIEAYEYAHRRTA